MSELKGKIDFTLFVSADNANPNGDPLNGNRPRINMDGHGEISDVCIKRKIRNRLQDLGQKIFVQSDDRTDDPYTSLKDRADGCEELKAQIGNKKNANRDACAAIACKEWLDSKKKNKYPTLTKKGSPIKSVKIVVAASSQGRVDLSNGRFADNDLVVRTDVYKKNTDDETIYMVPIYYYQIFKEKKPKYYYKK